MTGSPPTRLITACCAPRTASQARGRVRERFNRFQNSLVCMNICSLQGVASLASPTKLCNGQPVGKLASSRVNGPAAAPRRVAYAGHHAGAQQAGGRTDGRGRGEKEAGEHAAAKASEATGAPSWKGRRKTNESALGEGR